MQYKNRKPDAHANSTLELMHYDLAGPISQVGLQYILSFVDHNLCLITISILRQKSDTLLVIK